MSLFFDWLLNFRLLFLGNQSSAPSNHDASDDVDGGEDLKLPSLSDFIAYTDYPIFVLCV